MSKILPKDNEDASKNEALYRKPPTVLQMLKSFSGDLVEYVKKGAPNVSPEDYAARLDVCTKCPHIKTQYMRCGLCGCMIEHKAKWKTTACPDNPERWAKQDPVSNDKE
jgi:hypothetical protein